MTMNDEVMLVAVLPAGYISYSLSRKNAGQVIKEWVDAREKVACKEEGWELCRKWLQDGTMTKVAGTDEGVDYLMGAVAVKDVVGLCIYEKAPTAQERIAAAVERQARKGDEWKGDEE